MAAAPVVLVVLVVGLAVLSNRTDPAKVETKEDTPVPGPSPGLNLQGHDRGGQGHRHGQEVGDAEDHRCSRNRPPGRAAGAPRPTETSAKAAPTTAAPEDLSGFIGPVPPEPWPVGCRCAPLTGLGYDSPFGAGGPAVAVKVSNASQADPQTGLNRADLIYEEPSHGITSVSRFLAVFHSRDVDTVGPVRSARTSDPPLLAPMGRPILAFAGANKGVHWIVDIRERDGWLVQAHENKDGAPEFFRLDGRRDEHSLFARRNSLVQTYGGLTAPPNQQFSFMEEGATERRGQAGQQGGPQDRRHLVRLHLGREVQDVAAQPVRTPARQQDQRRPDRSQLGHRADHQVPGFLRRLGQPRGA